MSKPLGIVPLYYGVVIHPNDNLNVVMPPSQFARAEIASLSKDELTQLVSRLDQEMRDGRNDLLHLRGFWEQDFEGKKDENSLTIDDLEHAVKGELTPEGRAVVAELPAFNLVRLAAFGEGVLEAERGKSGFSHSMSHNDLLSIQIKCEESGVGKRAMKYWEVTVRAPFVYTSDSKLRVHEALEPHCQCKAHQKHIAKDARLPTRSTAIVCSHIASALRELYLEKEGTNEKRIRKLDDPSLISDRGQSVMVYRFYEAGVQGLAMEMLARRYIFGQELREIDNYLRDQDIFHEQFQALRGSGQARLEAVRSTQNFPKPYGGIKESMIRSLDQHGYKFLGYGYDFRGTGYQTIALVFMHPKNRRMAHIIFDKNLEKPYFLFKFLNGDEALSQYGNPVEALEGHPASNLKVPFRHTDDMFGEQRIGVVISPVTVLSGRTQKELYQE